MEKIFQIEKENRELIDFKVGDIKVWPLYRTILHFSILNNSYPPKRSSVRKFLSFIKRHLILFYKLLGELRHFKKWFSPYDYVIITNHLEIKYLDNKPIDKLNDFLIRLLKSGNNKVLLLYTSDEQTVSHPYIVSANIINRLSYSSLFPFLKTKPSVHWRSLIKNKLEKYNINYLNFEALSFNLKKSYLYSKLFKIWRPKIVFTACYSNYAEIFGAKKNNIVTVELQHGIISKAHPGYEAEYLLNRDFTADYLFTFGANSIHELSNNTREIDSNTEVVGQFYIEELQHQAKDPQLVNKVINFKKSVCIPTDYFTEDTIINFMLPIMQKLNDVLFLFVPRQQLSNKNEVILKDFKNVSIIKDLSFQEVVRHCDIHTATFSTCALEALSFGVPNILINVDNKAREYLGSKVDNRYTMFINTREEYINAIENFQAYDPKEIIEANKENFAMGHQQKLTEAVNKVKQKFNGNHS